MTSKDSIVDVYVARLDMFDPKWSIRLFRGVTMKEYANGYRSFTLLGIDERGYRVNLGLTSEECFLTEEGARNYLRANRDTKRLVLQAALASLPEDIGDIPVIERTLQNYRADYTDYD